MLLSHSLYKYKKPFSVSTISSHSITVIMGEIIFLQWSEISWRVMHSVEIFVLIDTLKRKLSCVYYGRGCLRCHSLSHSLTPCCESQFWGCYTDFQMQLVSCYKQYSSIQKQCLFLLITWSTFTKMTCCEQIFLLLHMCSFFLVSSVHAGFTRHSTPAALNLWHMLHLLSGLTAVFGQMAQHATSKAQSVHVWFFFLTWQTAACNFKASFNFLLMVELALSPL